MTARDYAVCLADVLRIGRENGILRTSSANDLIPEDRLAWIASATATLYIQSQRRGDHPPPETSSPSGAPANGGKGGGASGRDEPPAPANPASRPQDAPESIEPPQQDKDGTWYFTCAKCRRRKRWAPKGASAGKAPWPGATCWDCYKAGGR